MCPHGGLLETLPGIRKTRTKWRERKREGGGREGGGGEGKDGSGGGREKERERRRTSTREGKDARQAGCREWEGVGSVLGRGRGDLWNVNLQSIGIICF